MTFRILEHVAKLTPAEEKGRYICPVCQGHNFTFRQDGAYQCWNGCTIAAIREAIAPWSASNQAVGPRQKPNKPKPAPLPERIDLAKLPQPATDSPQPQKRFDKQRGEVQEWAYHYTPEKWKARIQWSDATKPKGRDKKFVLWHRDANGVAIAKAGEGVRPPYRIDELLTAAKVSGANAAMCGEGEPVVEAYRCMGIACNTPSGFSKDELTLLAQLFKAVGLTLIYHPDNDVAGRNKALKVQEACDRAGVPCVIIDPVVLCPGLPESGDVVDMLAVMEVPEFIKRLEAELQAGVEARRREQQLEGASEDIPDSLQRLLIG